MKIAYLINQYPSVSHSFIRREIQALERQGLNISRFSIRSVFDELVDKRDIEEHHKTKVILGTSVFKILLITFLIFLKNPLRWFKTLKLAIKTGRRSDRGPIKHIYYFIEACIFSHYCEKEKIQHIHAHFGTNPAAVAMLTSCIATIPYSFTVHGPEEFDKPEFLSLRQKIENSAFVAAISSFGKSQLFRQINNNIWHKIKIVHCGLDAEFYDGIIPPVSGEANLVCVGRLCEQKGQLLLLRAANILKQKDINFHLTLVGDGPMRIDIEDFISKNNLDKNVTITGWLSSDNVREEILKSRALVLPSFAEGLPVVIMESMVLQRPVITTYIAGIPELVISEQNGWLVPAGDVETLAVKMEECLTLPINVLHEMGQRAQKRVIERHNIEIEAAKLSALFQNSIAGKDI